MILVSFSNQFHVWISISPGRFVFHTKRTNRKFLHTLIISYWYWGRNVGPFFNIRKVASNKIQLGSSSGFWLCFVQHRFPYLQRNDQNILLFHIDIKHKSVYKQLRLTTQIYHSLTRYKSVKHYDTPNTLQWHTQDSTSYWQVEACGLVTL